MPDVVIYHIPVQLPLPFYDEAAQGVERLLRRMCFDDALTRGGWRLEYLHLERGYPHYRLYRSGALVGVVRLYKEDNPGYRDRELAVFLAGIGFIPDATRFIECGAKTPPDADVYGLPYLFPEDAAAAKKSPRKSPDPQPAMINA